jgi:hypothetical protein
MYSIGCRFTLPSSYAKIFIIRCAPTFRNEVAGLLTWILIISLASVWSGCVIHPDPSSEPRTKDSVEGQPPPDVEKTEPPRRPPTTCPSAMRGSC